MTRPITRRARPNRSRKRQELAVELDSDTPKAASSTGAIDTDDSLGVLDPDESVSEEAEAADEADLLPGDDSDDGDELAEAGKPLRRWSFKRVLVFGLLPAIALLLASGAGL